MEEKIPKNLEQLIRQLDQAVPPITPTGHIYPAGTNNGVGADTDSDREMAAMVNAARQLAHGPKPALPASSLDRIEAQLRARHAALHNGASVTAASHDKAQEIDSWATTTGPQRPISASDPAKRTAAARSNARTQSPSRMRQMARASWRGTKRTLRFAAALLLVMVLLTSGLTAASANSVPNEPLYTVKLGVEEIRLVLVSDEGEPALRINFAGRRLDEFQTLLARDIIYPKVLEEATAQMNRALTLLSAGYGNRQKLDAKIADLTHQQGQLLEEAAKIAPAEDYERLQVVSTWNNGLYMRLKAEGTIGSDPQLAADEGAPVILPETRPVNTTENLAGTPDTGQSSDDVRLSPDTANGDGMMDATATTDDEDPKATKENNKEKEKENNGQGQGNTGTTSNTGQGQGNTGNTGNTGNQGQGNSGNTGNQGQGNSGNQSQGNTGSTGNASNQGQGNENENPKK